MRFQAVKDAYGNLVFMTMPYGGKKALKESPGTSWPTLCGRVW